MAGDKKSDEQWIMSTPSERKVSDFLIGDDFDDEILDISDSEDSSLENELAHWGMDIPPMLLSDPDLTTSNTVFGSGFEIPGIIDVDPDEMINKFSMKNPSALDQEKLTEVNDDFMDNEIENDVDDFFDQFDDKNLDETSEEISENILEETKPSDEKKSILDHLGKNFFNDDSEEVTGEHTLDNLVKDIENENLEKNSKLEEFSTALRGENKPSLIQAVDEEEELFPDDSDLEYPDFADLMSSDSTTSDEDSDTLLPNDNDLAYPGEEVKTNSSKKPNSKLISAEELSASDDNEEGVETTDPSYNITQELKHDLEKEIEADRVNPDDFWATDDFPKIKQTLEKPITETQASKQIKEDFFKELDEDDNFKIIPSKRFSSITLDEVAPPKTTMQGFQALDKEAEERIIESVKKAIAPQIEKIVRELFSEKIEKVAWEVIPDLAENIIKSEVEEIAKQVYLSRDSDKK